MTRIVGMAHYTPEAWRELRALPEAKIEMSYPQFMRKCERLIAGFEASGFQVEKVPIDVGQMVAWCHRHGFEIDTKGRAVFGSVLGACRASGQDVMTAPFEDSTHAVQ
jgi:hypothetical protein